VNVNDLLIYAPRFVPYNPVFLMKMALKDELWLLEAAARLFIGRELDFIERIQTAPAYQRLVMVGVDAETLLQTCIMFRALELAMPIIRKHFRALRSKPPNGRPRSLFPLFQYCCGEMARDVSTLQFRDEFESLAELVYGKFICRGESYRRSLMRIRAMTPPPSPGLEIVIRAWYAFPDWSPRQKHDRRDLLPLPKALMTRGPHKCRDEIDANAHHHT
jgi:hypothetical protein